MKRELHLGLETGLLLALSWALPGTSCQRASALPDASARTESAAATTHTIGNARSLPERLADTGLYADAATLSLAPDVHSFEPQYPLWTDGAHKRRWIRLPAGQAIDARDPDRWVFPVGTRLWKEFAFERRIETRTMELVAPDTWEFATYLWNAGETDAVLAPERGVRAAWMHDDGERYDVPSRVDCRVCHLAGARVVLGFSALQLSPDRDPLAPHAVAPEPGSLDLARLVERGLIVGLPQELLNTPPRIPASSPRERAVLGYLHGNCGSCHSARGTLASLGMCLEHSLEEREPNLLALLTTLDVPTHGAAPGTHAPGRRVLPGDAAASVLHQRASSRNPLIQMPPLGTRVVDREALDLIEAWIREDLAQRPRTSNPPLSPSTQP
jgi:mono/diheme cytochrome c family protein